MAYLNSAAEVEAGISLVDHLELLPLQEGGHLWLPRQNRRDQIPRDFLLATVLEEKPCSVWFTLGGGSKAHCPQN
jgi:hypothetical protein